LISFSNSTSGSQAAHSCAAFLWQHKARLGIKNIIKVKVFRGAEFTSTLSPGGNPQRLPQMLFLFADVPKDRIKADPKPDWVPPPSVAVPGVVHQPNLDVPGPSTPRPAIPRPAPPDDAEPDWGTRKKRTPKITHDVKEEKSGNNLVRSHIFNLA
jgi:hypothetical protein